MALPETFSVRTPVATEVRRRERRWLDWINPRATAFGPLVARLGVGGIMLMHGLQKVGLFGGAGWAATMKTFTTSMHIPAPLAALAILTELVGGALLIAGVASRLVAFAVMVEMAVAAALVHLANGFFMNWAMEAGKGHGIEMNLALVALAAAVLVDGPGRWALDTKIARSLAASEEQTSPPHRTPIQVGR